MDLYKIKLNIWSNGFNMGIYQILLMYNQCHHDLLNFINDINDF